LFISVPSVDVFSKHALPPAFQDLMDNPASPIIDFYPVDIKQDPNGKRFPWQWVVLLPFIDEKRLTAAVESVKHTLTAEEIRKNSRGNDVILMSIGGAFLSKPLLDSYIAAMESSKTTGTPQMRLLQPSSDGQPWVSIFGRLVFEGDEPALGDTIHAVQFHCRNVRDNKVGLSTTFLRLGCVGDGPSLF
jgi:Xrn1 helical domain